MNWLDMEQRCSSRVIVLDPQGRVLMFRHAGTGGLSFWATPGGGLEDGETFEQAAAREAWEELGVTGATLRFLWESTVEFVHIGRPVRQRERFFLLEGTLHDLLRGVQTVHRREGILETRWWTDIELGTTKERVFPEELATHLRRIRQEEFHA